METTRPQPSPALRRLSAENLALDFAARSTAARHGVGALYEALLASRCGATAAAFDRWRTSFGKVCGRDLQHPWPAMAELAARWGIAGAGCATAGHEPPSSDALLFALHTYYALLVKLLAGEVLGRLGRRTTPAEQIRRADVGPRVRHLVATIESGDALRQLGVANLFGDDPFAWYLDEWSQPLSEFIGQAAAVFGSYSPLGELSGSGDLLKPLYEGLFPRPLRHWLGEYYTPDWLAQHVLDQAQYDGRPGLRLLDPACGSGTFLVAAIHRARAWHDVEGGRAAGDKAELCRRILRDVVGFDLNPLAVMTARANYLIAVGDLLGDLLGDSGSVKIPVEIPVVLRDSILDDPASHAAGGGEHVADAARFDCVVGNPPWIAWDHLPADYRRATMPLWERYGLFSLSGNEARHGGGKKDLSMLMICVSADRCLKSGGRLAMVVTQTLFQTKGAGDGFRRFRLGPEGERLKVLRVDDMTALRPFNDAANWTSTILLEKGSATEYPVPYFQWLPDGQTFRRRQFQAQPIDPSRPSSPWFLRPGGFAAELNRLVGPSDYAAHLGANSGGANGVFWLRVLGKSDGGVLVRNLADKGKCSLGVVEQVVESTLLYPLVRWSDVARFRATPSAHVLLAQDCQTRTGIEPAEMQRRCPQTYRYLEQFEQLLRSRAAWRRYQAGGAFYSMYNVGPYTIAPIKVVWRRMDRRINAAVATEVDDPLLGRRPIVPQETCVLIAAESEPEAHYLCALLNSSIVNFLVAAHSVRGGKGFGTPSMLDYVKLARFRPGDVRHQGLCQCSLEAHQAVAAGQTPEKWQQQIDRLAADLWELSPQELLAMY